MRLRLEFSDIIDAPQCCVSVNQQQLYTGEVKPYLSLFSPVTNGEVNLKISHHGKQPGDTVVVDGKIVRDRSFTLARVIVDGYDFEELIWESRFQSVGGEAYESCLFFGPNGDFVLDFEMPVLKWILSTRHKKNQTDPVWEQDYEYYVNACQLLSQISNK